MAYESPISVWWSDTKIEQLRDEYDNLIIKAVKNVCPEVDRDELIKALEYDRGQYEKGFADGIAYKPPVKSRGDSIRAMTDEELATFLTNNQVEVFRRVVKEMCNLLDVSFPYEELTKEVTAKYEEMKKEQLEWLKQEATE